MREIVLVGCGNVGSRILQALVSITDDAITWPLRIIVVDSSQAALDLAASRAHEARPDLESLAGSGALSVEFRTEIGPLSQTVDLGIVATTARPRLAVLEALLSRTRPRRMLLEKFLFTRFEDYDRADALLSEAGTEAFVHCPRAEWPIYQRLKREMKGRPIDLRVSGSAYNMASNAIHFVALYRFLAEVERFSFSGAELSGDELENRRSGYRELSGVLDGRGEPRGRIEITSRRDGSDPLVLEFITPGRRYVVDESGGQIRLVEDSGSSSCEPFQTVFVSQMSRTYAGLAEGRESNLPAYRQSAEDHKALMQAYNHAFYGDPSDRRECPVT
jgi:hypothetical protein